MIREFLYSVASQDAQEKNESSQEASSVVQDGQPRYGPKEMVQGGLA